MFLALSQIPLDLNQRFSYHCSRRCVTFSSSCFEKQERGAPQFPFFFFFFVIDVRVREHVRPSEEQMDETTGQQGGPFERRYLFFLISMRVKRHMIGIRACSDAIVKT
jgi:hypothetical protein